MQRTIKFIIILISLFIISIFFLSLGKDQIYNTEKILIGKKLDQLSLKSFDGDNFFNTNDFKKNNFTLINFWASWCAPCRQENPNLVRLHKKYNRQGFDILSVSLDNVRSRWVQAIKDDNLYWEGHCSDLNGWNTEIVNMYNIQGIPTSFLIGRNGLMIWNSNNPQLSLEEAIKEAL